MLPWHDVLFALLICMLVVLFGGAAEAAEQMLHQPIRRALPAGAKLPESWQEHVDAVHRFRMGHPLGFVVRRQNESRLERLVPKPMAAFFFMNPSMASGALAEIEPPDVALRIYPATETTSLEQWLLAVGFVHVGADSIQPYSNARGVKGLRVCNATLMTPNCALYVLVSGFVYQMSSISLEGEAMIETFSPIPAGK